MESIKVRFFSYLLLLSFPLVISAVGYGVYVDFSYFLLSKNTKALVVDKYIGNQNLPYIRIEFYDEFEKKNLKREIKIENGNIDDYKIGKTVNTRYISFRKWIFIEGQPKPNIGLLIFYSLIVIGLIISFIKTLKDNKWRGGNLIK